jgi:hypothetical protein
VTLRALRGNTEARYQLPANRHIFHCELRKKWGTFSGLEVSVTVEQWDANVLLETCTGF